MTEAALPARRRVGRWGWLLLALAVAGGAARLGVWQLDRARQKTELQARLAERRALPPLDASALPRDAAGVQAVLHRSLRVQGRWLGAHSVYLDNRPLEGRAGFEVLTPLQLDGGRAVLVQRGWVARDPADRTRVQVSPPPQGPVRLLARVAAAPSRVAALPLAASGPAAGGGGPIRQNLDVDAYAREVGLPLLPLLLVQVDDPDAAAASDGLLRRWPEPAADVARHHGYAFQWFALAALAVGLYAWFQLVPIVRRRA